jgi:hypothetical protein
MVTVSGALWHPRNGDVTAGNYLLVARNANEIGEE